MPIFFTSFVYLLSVMNDIAIRTLHVGYLVLSLRCFGIEYLFTLSAVSMSALNIRNTTHQ